MSLIIEKLPFLLVFKPVSCSRLCPRKNSRLLATCEFLGYNSCAISKGCRIIPSSWRFPSWIRLPCPPVSHSQISLKAVSVKGPFKTVGFTF
jgi:hypothetical protein